ncbi:hypothetical protein Tco_0408903 [Tanacetum coccineum]
MKEILHDRMFESGSYRSHPDHAALYKALEVSIQRENNDELHATLAQSCKRRRDDQDPPPPPPKDSDRSKNKRHDSDVSTSKQPPGWERGWDEAEKLGWECSSMQKPASPSVQPIDDNPILEDLHLSESEDTSATHLPKIKTKPVWLKPVPEEDTPKTPKPDWVIPPNYLPKTENN